MNNKGADQTARIIQKRPLLQTLIGILSRHANSCNNMHVGTLVGGLVPDACLWLGPPWLGLGIFGSDYLWVVGPFLCFCVWCVNLIRVFLHV